jgi:hypothetical protein
LAQTLLFHSPAQTTDHSPQLRIDISFYEISGPDICSLICDLKLGKTGAKKTVKIIAYKLEKKSFPPFR